MSDKQKPSSRITKRMDIINCITEILDEVDLRLTNLEQRNGASVEACEHIWVNHIMPNRPCICKKCGVSKVINTNEQSDSCSVERSNTPQGLKPFNRDELLTLWCECLNTEKTSAADFIDLICAKFAVPNEGLSEERLRKILFASPVWYSLMELIHDSQLHDLSKCKETKDKFVKALLSALENKR